MKRLARRADNGAVCTMPVPNVAARILGRVIDYLAYHAATHPVEEAAAWDAAFMGADRATTLETMIAANFLDARELLDPLCAHVASLVRGKTPEQIREIFNIQNDFTPEEGAEARREHAWAFD